MESNVNPRILAVEDDAAIRRLIDRSLRSEGYQLDTCGSAEAALPVIAGGDYSLLLLDVRMGGETGFDLARRVRDGQAGEHNRALPIVFLTAEAGETSYEQSFDVGAQRYLTKPFESSELVETVCSVLHGE